MRPNKRLSALFLGALASLWSAPSVLAAGASTVEARIDPIVEETLASGRAAGAVVAVVYDGKLVMNKGYGLADLEHSVPATPDTVFRIASVTKPFTATAIMLLAERNLLSLDDPVSKHLSFPGGDKVTIRQLLTHTSGLRDFTEDPSIKTVEMQTLTTGEFVQHIAGIRPLYNFPPGTGWRYSNSGYYLLGAIIEKISGTPLATFLRENVFDKAGMTATAFDRHDEIVKHRASGYILEANEPGAFRHARYISMTTPGPAGALRSTASDLAAWSIAFFGGGIVPPETVNEMTAPARLSDGRVASLARHNPPPGWDNDYGYGFILGTLDGHRRIGHSGLITGFSSTLQHFPDRKLTIIILANTYRTALELERVIARTLLASGSGLAEEKP